MRDSVLIQPPPTDIVARLNTRADELQHESRVNGGEWTSSLLREAAKEIAALREVAEFVVEASVRAEVLPRVPALTLEEASELAAMIRRQPPAQRALNDATLAALAATLERYAEEFRAS